MNVSVNDPKQIAAVYFSVIQSKEQLYEFFSRFELFNSLIVSSIYNIKFLSILNSFEILELSDDLKLPPGKGIELKFSANVPRLVLGKVRNISIVALSVSDISSKNLMGG